MKILMAHNYYQLPGGEDRAFNSDIAELAKHGNNIFKYEVNNTEINTINKLDLLVKSHWNFSIYKQLCDVISTFKPDIIHFHNTFPLISTSGYDAALKYHIPVVQTIHNFRLFCLNAMFLRENMPCEDCPKHLIPWPGIIHACYRNSISASFAHASVQVTNRLLNQEYKKVDKYIALTDFARAKLIEHGLPPEKIIIRPNSIIDPATKRDDQGFILFVGRLSVQKGLPVLIKALDLLKGNIPVKIAGSGPLEDLANQFAKKSKSIEFLGQLNSTQVAELMRKASLLIFPSLSYEVLPFVLLEALAAGTPVVASRIGGLPEIIEDHRIGVLFSPNDAVDLANKIEWLITHPDERLFMSRNARQAYLSKYTPEASYDRLIQIYESLI